MKFFPACLKGYNPNSNPDENPEFFSNLDLMIVYKNNGFVFFEFHCESKGDWFTTEESWRKASETARNLFYKRTWNHLEPLMLGDVDAELERRKTNPLLTTLLKSAPINKNKK